METFFPVLGMEGSPLSLNNHEVLRDEPDGAWAARPLELIREGGEPCWTALRSRILPGERARSTPCSPRLA